MNTPHSLAPSALGSSIATRLQRAILPARLLVAAAAICLAGCDEDATTQEGAAPTKQELEASVHEVEITMPARVSDARQAMDLSSVPMIASSENPAERTVTGLVYRAAGSIDEGFKFHREQLVNGGWKELPGASVTPQDASAVFAKRGLHLSLTVMPDQAGKVGIAMHHHGNVRFEKLPMPGVAKSIYAGPMSAIFSCDLPADTAARELAAALVEAGWSPYGSAGNTQSFKQNAVMLSVMTASAPGQGGKTTMNFSSEMLPVDVPVPPGAMEVQFVTGQKRLIFEVKLKAQECIAYYQESLGKLGWQTNMKEPMKINSYDVLVFRNEAKDMLKVGTRPGREGGLRVFAEHMTAAEIDEMNRRLDAQAEAYKAKKAAAAAR